METRGRTNIEALVQIIGALNGPTLVVVTAAYPRNSHTGSLPEVGAAIMTVWDHLSRPNVVSCRGLWPEVFALMPATSESFALVKTACAEACSAEIEIRSVQTCVSSPRDSLWFDDLICELSLRSNFGSFSRDPVRRLIDGKEV